jgi:ABC-type multidrug transport system ATPase subunit
MPVLEIKNLTKHYGKIKAIHNLNLTIEKGNIYGLLGPNGSGKTTTLGIILDILHQDSGTFEWFDGKYGAHCRIHIGAILETPNFYPYLNAQENLEIISMIKGVEDTDYDTLLELVNLAHRKKSAFRTYSLGMKQRLAIAATMIGNPQVLIFDEPTNGLDPQGIAEVRTILKKVADAGHTVIMASHILDEVEKICSHVAIIKNGHLLATGPVGSILSNDITIEIDAEDRESLAKSLSEINYVHSITIKKDWIECMIDEEVRISDFSKNLSDLGISITRLVARKKRLEEEFLEITKGQ